MIYRFIQYLMNIILFHYYFLYRDNIGVESLYTYFVIDTKDSFGNSKTIELKLGGSEILVTDENKDEYIE